MSTQSSVLDMIYVMYFRSTVMIRRVEYLHTIFQYNSEVRPRPEYNREVRPTLRFHQIFKYDEYQLKGLALYTYLSVGGGTYSSLRVYGFHLDCNQRLHISRNRHFATARHSLQRSQNLPAFVPISSSPTLPSSPLRAEWTRPIHTSLELTIDNGSYHDYKSHTQNFADKKHKEILGSFGFGEILGDKRGAVRQRRRDEERQEKERGRGRHIA